LPDFRKRERTIDLPALLLRHDDARGTKRGQLDRNIGERDSQLGLESGYRVGLLSEQI
jgi:hypothetical protein